VVLLPQVFPLEEKPVVVDLDRLIDGSREESLADLYNPFRGSGSAVKPDKTKRMNVPGKVSRGEVVVFPGPAAIYSIGPDSAIRITGVPPRGKAEAAAAKCVDLARTELKRHDFKGLAVKNLSTK
jgi:hypothetical protein